MSPLGVDMLDDKHLFFHFWFSDFSKFYSFNNFVMSEYVITDSNVLKYE